MSALRANAVLARLASVRWFSRPALREIPAPRALPLVGTTLDILAAGGAPKLHIYIDRRHKQLGPIFRETIGPNEAYFIADPKMMREVFRQEGKQPEHMLPDAWCEYNKMYGCSRGLFFMDGEEWYFHRKIMNKLLLKNDSSDLMKKLCHAVTDDLAADLDKICQGRRTLELIPNLEDLLYQYSIKNVIAFLVGTEYIECQRKLKDFIEKFALVVRSVFVASSKIFLIPAETAARLKLPVWNKFVGTVTDALYFGNVIVNEIMKMKGSEDGLLRKMLELGISRDNAVKIAVDLILAAGDTTAYTTQWAIHLLSTNRDVQEKLSSDPNAVGGSPYMKGVVKETLRLYPTAPFLTRILPNGAIIGDYELPKKARAILSIYTSGREEKLFPDPSRFYPERWSRDETGLYGASTHASLPFAMGTRSCIGKKLAENQMFISLSRIVQRYELLPMNDAEVEMVLRLISVPASPLKIAIRRK